LRPRHFRTAGEFRRWLAAHSATRRELWVGYYKRGTGEPSMGWSESVDEAICFGWIDGLRKALDERRYVIRFAPRKPGSIWSSVNIQRAVRLSAQGLMQPAGLAAYELRRANRSGVYSYEQRPTRLPAAYARLLAQDAAAGRHFAAQPPSYRRAAIWWVVSAKQEATRLRRLAQLIADSAQGRRIKALARPPA
jgi:uncharacterized protein YdeI (YjbR/CyaY-like superfamily)